MRRHSLFASALAVALAAALALPVLAHADGTGDDPTPTQDVLSAEDASAKAVEDAQFESWQATNPAEFGGTNALAAVTLGIDAPYYYIWTPSHKQERTYWCGPATAQIITHYWGPLYSQTTFSNWLHTTKSGTDFSLLDDCLRNFARKSYYYYGNIGDWSTFCGRVAYGIGTRHFPIAADVNIDPAVWPYYEMPHSGHILPIEAFDWRTRPYNLRVNDPYDETSIGGGRTYGHTTYPAWVVYQGIQSHFRHALIG